MRLFLSQNCPKYCFHRVRSIASQRRERRIIPRGAMAAGELERRDTGLLYGVDHRRKRWGDRKRSQGAPKEQTSPK